jgi:molecular chaperone GrpE (heat shock protein)
MCELLAPKVSKWPFFMGDAALVGVAWFIQNKLTMGHWETAFIIVCVAGGAWLGVTPFLLEYRLLGKLAEAKGLATVTTALQNLEALAGQIGGATGQWQGAQEQAGMTVATAKEIAGRMAAEAEAFKEFMTRANDIEKANLRLEVEKLRRSEADWVHVTVRMLDHVFALHEAGRRSGQPRLIEELGHFQAACCDATRRVGLAPFVAAESEPFDEQRHQVVEGDGKPVPGALVAETIATGFTFQGRLLRPALVRLKQVNGAAPAAPASVEPAEGQPLSQLPLEPEMESNGAESA